MKLFRTISAILLAALVLMSSTSFLVSIHYCMGKVHDVSMFEKASTCQDQQAVPSCHKQSKPACCQDEVVYHDGNDFNAASGMDVVTTPVVVTVEHPMVLITEVIPASLESFRQFDSYDPPLWSADLTVRHHSFLI